VIEGHGREEMADEINEKERLQPMGLQNKAT